MSKNALYSETVKANFRTYFFDLKESEKGNTYLTICESRLNKESGEYEKVRIRVWDKDFGQFAEALSRAVEHRQEKAETSSE